MLTKGRKLVVALEAILALGPAVLARAMPWDFQQAAPDNSKSNQDRSLPTADQQKMNSSDRTVTQNIRKAIIADKSLSTYAHNVKIITQNGKVTLRGPVGSEEEKANIESKAAGVAGQENVTSQIEVTPLK